MYTSDYLPLPMAYFIIHVFKDPFRHRHIHIILFFILLILPKSEPGQLSYDMLTKKLNDCLENQKGYKINSKAVFN